MLLDTMGELMHRIGIQMAEIWIGIQIAEILFYFILFYFFCFSIYKT